MDIGTITACAYNPGELSSYSFIRAGQGWDYHQGPILFPFADGRLQMCWGAYDIDECSNDGVVLYSTSQDQGETWDPPQVFMASPNAVVSHLHFAEAPAGGGAAGEAIVIYREGHYYGIRTDRLRKARLSGANYAESPMHLLQKRSRDGGFTWDPPTAIDPVLVMGCDRSPYYGAPEQVLTLASGELLLSVGYMDPDRRDPQHFNVAFLLSADGGRTWEKVSDLTVPEVRGAMEPSAAEVEPGHLYCAIRNKSGYVYETRSEDGGRTWVEPAKTAIPTVEAMVRVLQLASGRLLMVWNNQSSTTQQPRHPLVATLSDDGGRTWGPVKVLADDVEANQLTNFNHLQTADGRILVCTSHYRATPPACSDLDLLVFDQEWLEG